MLMTLSGKLKVAAKVTMVTLRVSVLAYVTNRAIMKRLDTVCGKGNWKRNEYKDLPNNAGVQCGISIKIDGEWVTKWDAAPNDPDRGN